MVLGLAFRDQIETGGRNLVLIVIALIAGGIVLAASERVGRRIRPLGSLNATDASVIGFAQAAALVPGISRSGATISAGLFRQLDRSAAARYSFLLSVPAVVLSGLFEARKVGGAGVGLGTALVATAVAFVVGYASISFLLRWVARHSMDVFAVYRITLGLITLGLATTSAIFLRDEHVRRPRR